MEIKRNFPPTMPTCRDEHLPTRPFASPTQPVPSHLSEEAVREKLGEIEGRIAELRQREATSADACARGEEAEAENAAMGVLDELDDFFTGLVVSQPAASLSASSETAVEDCDDLCTCGQERFAHMRNETEPGPCLATGRGGFELAPASSETGGAGAETFIGIRPCALNRDGFHRTQRVSKKCRSCGESETGLRDPIAPLREAVTDLQGVVYSPPGPPPADLDKALSAVARCVDRLDKDFATSPQQSVPDTGTKGGPRYPVPDPPREVPGREGEVVGPCAEECGCPLPAIVRDDGTCSGCGSQVVPPANPSSTTRGGQ